MANLANLVNFGSGGSLAVGDWTYSLSPLTAPTYLPLNNDEASYLTSSYPALGAIYAPTTVAYSATTVAVPPLRNPGNAALQWNALFGNRTFFLWHSSGNMLVSTDLVNWVSRGIPVQTMKYATAYPGGPTTEVSSGTFNGNWGSMCYGNGKLVAIRPLNITRFYTSDTTAVSSDNGITWAFGGLPSQAYGGGVSNIAWTGVTFGDGTFTAFGTGSNAALTIRYGVVAQSNDGLNWSLISTSLYGIGGINSNFITYGNGIYLLFPSQYSGVYYSNNNFTSATPAGGFGTLWPSACAYGNGIFVVVGSDSAPGVTTTAYSSPTGATWTARTLPSAQNWTSVTFANGYFVAVGSTGAASTVIATSPDGITWTSQTVASTTNRGAVAGGMGKFIYQNDYSASAQTLTQISLSTSSTSFSLPMVMNPPTGTQAYIKAT